MPDRWNDPMRPDPFDPARSGSGMSGEREPYAYERERLITERERLREKYERERLGEDPDGNYDPRQDDGYPQPATPRRRRGGIGRWIVRGTGIGIILLVIAIIWLAITAPL